MHSKVIGDALEDVEKYWDEEAPAARLLTDMVVLVELELIKLRARGVTVSVPNQIVYDETVVTPGGGTTTTVLGGPTVNSCLATFNHN